MNPTVLIIANIHDFSADLVCLRLAETETEFIRINREHFPEFRFGLDPISRTLSVSGRGLEAEIGPSLRTVWFRQPVFQRNLPANPLSPSEQLARSQWSAFLRALCVLDQAAWMNHPQCTYLAESKPYQLGVALRCGFSVPDTLITNDATAVHRRFPGSLVVKSLDTVLLRDNEDCLFTYTTIAHSDLLTDENTSAVPLLAQQLVETKTDLRVTVIGELIFAVRILAKSGSISGDWRVVPREKLFYEDVELAADIRKACLELVRTLGLAFAAIDLVETSHNTFFIEINPTGEWSWLSNHERPIDRAIGEWLAHPPHSKRMVG